MLSTTTYEVTPLQSETESQATSLREMFFNMLLWHQSKDRSRLNYCRLDFGKARRDMECNLIQINTMDPGLRAGASRESSWLDMS